MSTRQIPDLSTWQRAYGFLCGKLYPPRIFLSSRAGGIPGQKSFKKDEKKCESALDFPGFLCYTVKAFRTEADSFPAWPFCGWGAFDAFGGIKQNKKEKNTCQSYP